VVVFAVHRIRVAINWNTNHGTHTPVESRPNRSLHWRALSLHLRGTSPPPPPTPNSSTVVVSHASTPSILSPPHTQLNGDTTSSVVLVVCATLFVHLYHMSRNSLFLITTGLSLMLVNPVQDNIWVTRAAATLIAGGFGLQSTSMPSRCKLYSLGFLIA
jgi:hypothetical protein